MASAALPFLFPPVEVDGRAYVDGGLRQNTPLRPVIHAGVDRVLLIGAHAAREAGMPEAAAVVPSLAFLAGKSMNALMADPVERDVATTQRFNELLDWGARRYGPGFLAEVSAALDLRPVHLHAMRPSVDLGRLAAATFQESPPSDVPNLRWLLHMMADQANASGGESDLLSYLYFDRAFTAAAEQQGYDDAAAQADALVDFFTGRG
jgi:NTE family protein